MITYPRIPRQILLGPFELTRNRVYFVAGVIFVNAGGILGNAALLKSLRILRASLGRLSQLDNQLSYLSLDHESTL